MIFYQRLGNHGALSSFYYVMSNQRRPAVQPNFVIVTIPFTCLTELSICLFFDGKCGKTSIDIE